MDIALEAIPVTLVITQAVGCGAGVDVLERGLTHVTTKIVAVVGLDISVTHQFAQPLVITEVLVLLQINVRAYHLIVETLTAQHYCVQEKHHVIQGLAAILARAPV